MQLLEDEHMTVCVCVCVGELEPWFLVGCARPMFLLLLLLLRQFLVLKAAKRHKNINSTLLLFLCFFVLRSTADGHDLSICMCLYVCMYVCLCMHVVIVNVLAVCSFVYLHDNL